MNRFLKTTVLTLAVAATTLAALPAAQAGDWRRHDRHHHRSGDLVAAGVLGLAVGAIASGIATSNDRVYDGRVYDDQAYDEPVYRQPVARPHPYRGYDVQPQYVDGPDVVYADRAAEPWSRGWYNFCENRYRSFNPRTGTFVGYDGAEHFCVAN